MNDARDRYMQSWKGKAEAATGGNQSQLGAMLIAILGRTPHAPPMFARYLSDGTVVAGKAVITVDGFVLCDFIHKSGIYSHHAIVCNVSDMVRNFRGLADHLKLTDAERKEMFDEVKKWIERDYRAKSDENLF
jgi:hypothetical protein